MTGIALREAPLGQLVRAYGGAWRGDDARVVRRFAPVAVAQEGDLVPVLSSRFLSTRPRRSRAGATLLVARELSERRRDRARAGADVGARARAVGHGEGARTSAASRPKTRRSWGRGPLRRARRSWRRASSLGDAACTWARLASSAAPASGGCRRPAVRCCTMPQQGGVVLEDDVYVGAALHDRRGRRSGPTVVRRGAKLDAHVHVGHNADRWRGAMRRGAGRLRGLGDDRAGRAHRRPGGHRRSRHDRRRRARSPPRAASSATYRRGRSWQDTRRCRGCAGCEAWRRVHRGSPRAPDEDSEPRDRHRAHPHRSCRTAGRS